MGKACCEANACSPATIVYRKVQARTNVVYHSRKIFRSDPLRWFLNPCCRVIFVSGGGIGVLSSLKVLKADGSDATNSKYSTGAQAVY